MRHGLKVGELAQAIHPYPTYSTAVQQLAAEIATELALSSTTGKVAAALSKWLR